VGVCLGKGKGKLNTIKIKQGCEFAFTLARHGVCKCCKKASGKIMADFLFCEDGYGLAKVSASRRVRVLQGWTKGETKNMT